MLGRWKNSRVAVKLFHGDQNEQAQTQFLRECSAHKGVQGIFFEFLSSVTGQWLDLRHPNIVQLLGICTSPLCVLTEWMGRGSLWSLLQSDMNLEWNMRLQFGVEVARGMNYIHRMGILHRSFLLSECFIPLLASHLQGHIVWLP